MAADPTPSEEKTLRTRLIERRDTFKEKHPLAHRVGTEIIAGAAYGAAIVGVVTLGVIAGSKMTSDEDEEDEE